MAEGLLDPSGHSNIKMLPSFVHKKPTENISGTFYALDLGGTNFRVIRLVVKKGKVVDITSEKYSIPQTHMKGTAEGLFGFIAECCAKFAKGGEGKLGFTFSFPCQQISLASALLIHWTKGFTTTGVEGEDVLALLQNAFDKKGCKLETLAVVNDTVGTLIAKYFEDPRAVCGVILGTGSNACYFEKVRNIPKFPGHSTAGPDDEMVVNMEWGGFDSKLFGNSQILKISPYDAAIDSSSPNPGAQRFEKMMGGMYLGEICRVTMLKLMYQRLLPNFAKMYNKNGFQTYHMSMVLADETSNLSEVEGLLKELYATSTTLRQRKLVKEVCYAVARRSARLAATGISAAVLRSGREKDCVVAIDGSVFEKVPGYKAHMYEALAELFEDRPYNISLEICKDGSGKGAGLIAALASA